MLLTEAEINVLRRSAALGYSLSPAEEHALKTGSWPTPDAPKASLPKRVWYGWLTWGLLSLFAALLGAATHSGIVLIVLLVLAAAAAIYVVRSATS
jgi:hypothetical protein